MQIKTGTARGQPLFLIYRLCYCSRAGERGVGGAPVGGAGAGLDEASSGQGQVGVPAAEGFDTMPTPLVRTFRPPAPGARRNWMSLRPGVSAGLRLSGGASG